MEEHLVYEPIKAGSIDGTDVTPHDHAIVRALQADYDPSRDPSITGKPHKTVFIGRLSYDTTEETLKNMFAKFGKIRKLTLIRDLVTGKSRGYAFIEYDHESDFREAYRAGVNLFIDGVKVLVDVERERAMEGWVPRRLGGGFGGKKESGQLRFGGRDRPWKRPIMNPLGRGRGGRGRGRNDYRGGRGEYRGGRGGQRFEGQDREQQNQYNNNGGGRRGWEGQQQGQRQYQDRGYNERGGGEGRYRQEEQPRGGWRGDGRGGEDYNQRQGGY